MVPHYPNAMPHALLIMMFADFVEVRLLHRVAYGKSGDLGVFKAWVVARPSEETSMGGWDCPVFFGWPSVEKKKGEEKEEAEQEEEEEEKEEEEEAEEGLE